MNAGSVADRPASALRLLAWAASVFALWALQHTYPGIYHDAQLYTLQALARVLPAELGDDVFLKYGSQDRFTFFSPIYAGAIRVLGAEPAAALLTFLFHVAFVAAMVLLARRVLPLHLVGIGVALVCVIPLTYGARKVFFVMEDFVTARLLAEALVIAGLAALFAGRYRLAALAAVLAALMHPIMALTGLAVALFLDVFSRRQRAWLLAAGAAALLAVLAAMAIRGVPLQFDADWWTLVHGGLPYLFPLEWRATDWARVLVVAALLYSGTRLALAPARNLSRAALIALGLGIALSIIGGDLLRLVFLTQLQPWRVAWLASAIALLLSPLILQECWRAGTIGRCAAAAIAAAFLLADERFALPVAAVAATLAVAAGHLRQEIPALRLAMFGMFGLVVLALVINLGSASLVARPRFEQLPGPHWLGVLRSVGGTGVAAALVLIGLAWWLPRLRAATAGIAAAACTIVAALVAAAVWPQWSQSPYTRAAHAAFAPWRALLPAHTEVLWFEAPVATWALLDRPNFASNPQTAAVVFSRESGMLLRDRLVALQPYLDHVENVAWRAPVPEAERREPTLSAACAVRGVGFVVSRDQLEVAPIATSAGSLPARLQGWKLYACSELRAQRSAG